MLDTISSLPSEIDIPIFDLITVFGANDFFKSKRAIAKDIKEYLEDKFGYQITNLKDLVIVFDQKSTYNVKNISWGKLIKSID